MKKIILLACFWISGAHASDTTDDSPIVPQSVWLNPGFHSYHFNRDEHFRENNYGLGIQVAFSPSNSVMAGQYRNSDNDESHYIGWVWQPVNIDSARIGLVAAAVDGYPGGGQWFAAVLPLISFEYRSIGINFYVTPSYKERVNGALVAQFKLRVW